MAQSLFKVLRQRFPALEIDVLAPAWSHALLQRMPEVRRALEMPLGHGDLGLGRRYQLGKSLRKQGYDWSIVLPRSFKSALVPFWAHIKRRTGYRGEMRYGLLNDIRPLDKLALPKVVDRYVNLAGEPGSTLPDDIPRPALNVDRNNIHAALTRLALEKTGNRLLALCPGAEYGPAKRWPPEYFSGVARHYLNKGWTVWVFGSDKDATVAKKICQQAGSGCINLAGKTRLAEAIDLLSLASVVVTNDSGLMHVAAAVDRPLVAIFGSSDPGYTPPLHPDARIVHLGLECSPCFQRECRYGHYNCLRNITESQIVSEIEQVRR
jgi:heptosyltransferase-2